MTLQQFLNVVRRRHNAESDSYWSDEEIYELITNRANEALSVIGLIEAVDETNTSVAGTQTVAYPTNASTIRQVDYDGKRLKRISFRQWNEFKNRDATPTPQGTPSMYFVWNRLIYMVSIPAATGDVISIWFYKEHPYIDNSSQMTIDVPSILHPFLVHGVVGDMFAKELNAQMAGFYEDKWVSVSMPAFAKYKSDEEEAGQFTVIGDADTQETSNIGIL
jgi:hypothetical protein